MSNYKGILLAGGRGSRLYPLTAIVSKQLQPVYDKPMVYYSLTTLMAAGIQDILVISTPEDLPRFEQLLGDGSQWGIKLSYARQDEPRGIAEALIIGADHLAGHGCVLILGDNLIYGHLDFLRDAIRENQDGATIFAYEVADPTAFGVVEFDENMKAISLEEKPKKPRSNWAVPGIYVYGPGAEKAASQLEPSARGELEITDLNRTYLDRGALRVAIMKRGVAWLDTGTPESLLNASNFVHTLQARQGLVIGSPDEAAYRLHYLDKQGFVRRLQSLPVCAYRDYLQSLAETLK